VARLSKRDVEALVEAIDTELLQDAVAVALRHVLEVDPFPGDWPALVRLAGERAGWDPARRALVVDAVPDALAALAVELNENRTI
jgi:hypothetical protein